MTEGSAYVYWDNHADESKGQPRYYGFAEIDGTRYRISGWIDTAAAEKRVKLVFRKARESQDG